MKFRTLVSSGKEVLFVGHERGNATLPEEWLAKGRWKISMVAFDSYLSNHLAEATFGSSIDGFLFGFEIADFEKWGE